MRAAALITASTAPAASSTTTVTPCRALDTRAAGSTQLANGDTRDLVVRERCDVPATATGVIANVTALNGTANSYLTVHTAGGARPDTSTLNWSAGAGPIANQVTASLSDDGAIAIYNHDGLVDILVDVTAYLSPTTGGEAGPEGKQGERGLAGQQGVDGRQGIDGKDGRTVLSGHGEPGMEFGIGGDFYIDTHTSTIYGPKAEGWGDGASLVGPAGQDGTGGSGGVPTVRTLSRGEQFALGPSIELSCNSYPWTLHADGADQVIGVVNDAFVSGSASIVINNPKSRNDVDLAITTSDTAYRLEMALVDHYDGEGYGCSGIATLTEVDLATGDVG